MQHILAACQSRLVRDWELRMVDGKMGREGDSCIEATVKNRLAPMMRL